MSSMYEGILKDLHVLFTIRSILHDDHAYTEVEKWSKDHTNYASSCQARRALRPIGKLSENQLESSRRD